jgi:hypothetical protein
MCWSALLLAIAMPAPSTQRQGPAHHFCFLVPCWHCVRPHLALQLPSLVPRRHIVLAQARLSRGPIQRHYLASSPVLTAYGQTPSASPPPKAVATATSLLCMHALLSLCRRAESSPPSLPPCIGPRCAHVMRVYEKRPPLHLIRTHAVSPFGKLSPPHSPLFSTASLVPSHLTPTSLLIRRPHSFTRARSCSPTRRPVVGRAASTCSALWPGCGRPSARCAHGPSSVSAQKSFKKLKISFLVFIRFQTEFKLQNLYLNI